LGDIELQLPSGRMLGDDRHKQKQHKVVREEFGRA